jgi:ParB family chromosome partitioning protein
MEEKTMMLQNEENVAQEKYVKGNLYHLSIADFRPDPDQPRKVIDPAALKELQESIGRHGILQPLLFREGEGGWLIIVSGERRYQAAMALGILILPAICVSGNHAEIALVENLQRQDLTCIEEAEALKKLMDDENYTQEQAAAAIGKPRATIAETVLLNNLPQEIRNECRGDRAVSKKRLVEIARCKQLRSMQSAYAKYREELRKEADGVTTARVKLPSADSLLRALDETRARVEKAAPTGWEAEQTAAVKESIAALIGALNNLSGVLDGNNPA